MKPYNKVVNISWDQFYEDCAFLSRLVKNHDMQDATMIVISNGGLYVGGLLGKFLKNDKINTVGAKKRPCKCGKEECKDCKIDVTYFDTETIKNKIITGNSKILIVDEIYDSGSTAAAVYAYIVENCFLNRINTNIIYYATPYFKSDKLVSAEEVNPLLISPMNIEFGLHLKFPWEKDEND